MIEASRPRALEQLGVRADEHVARGAVWISITAYGREGSSGMPWRGFDPRTKGNHWKFSRDNLDRLDTEGRIHWPVKGGWPAAQKQFFDPDNGIVKRIQSGG